MLINNFDNQVTVFILNYKTYNKTLNCLVSIKKTKQIKNIIVIDNDVVTDEFLILKNKFKNYKNILFISTLENLGYAKGNNFGIKWAISKGLVSEFIAIINNDIIISNNYIFSDLINVYNSNFDIGVLSPKIIHKSTGLQQGPYKKEFIFFIFLEAILPFLIIIRKYLEKKSNNLLKMRKVHRTMGSFLLIKSSFFKEIDFFDENTFLGSEEDIISEKLKKHNLNFYHYPNQFVIHDHGASTSLKPSFFIHKLFLQSKVYYFKKYRKSSLIGISVLKFSENLKYLLRKFNLLK